jgi:Ca2+/Na+ antiporter
MSSERWLFIASKIGAVLFLLGIGLSIAGVVSYFAESHSHINKSIMVGGLSITALGYVVLTLRFMKNENI